jgi:hypothetical protein
MDYAAWQTQDLVELSRQLVAEDAGADAVEQVITEIERRERATPQGALKSAEEVIRFLSSPESGDLTQVEERVVTLLENEVPSHLSDKDRARLGQAAVETYAKRILEDDALSDPERFAFWDLWSAFGLVADESPTLRELADDLYVASANAGSLVSIPDPQLIAHADEHVHLERPASLIRDVAVREWQGGSQGVSFRIAKGVSYRVGAVRARSVVVGTEKQVQDSGLLAVTSKRVVYLGKQKTFEFLFSKLLNLDVYNDGIVFHVSNRQNAPMFRVDNGHLVAGIVNAAAQMALGLANHEPGLREYVPELEALADEVLREAHKRGHPLSEEELRPYARQRGLSTYEAMDYLGRRAVQRAIDVERMPPLPAPATTDTKVCPDCAETVKTAARICRFCSHNFELDD